LTAAGVPGAEDENCFHPNLLGDHWVSHVVGDFVGKVPVGFRVADAVPKRNF